MPKHTLNGKAIPKKSAADVKEVEACLDDLFNKKILEAQALDPRYQDLIAVIKQFVGRGGKRLRPQLLINAYEAFGGHDRRSIIKVAAGQELFHAFALMHDDIIDRDTVRWGGPNITGHYLNEFSGRLSADDARHNAEAWSLLSGDLCLGLVYETITDSRFTPGRKLKALQMLNHTLHAMVGGELMDISVHVYDLEENETDEAFFRRLYEAKTSVYSFSMPLRMGAMLAGASAAHDKKLKEISSHLGIAFQIRDDILGIFGDESKIGKPTLSDIREGRRTLLISFGLAMATARQKQVLQSVLGNPEASYADLKTVQTILRRSGALTKTESVMQSHGSRARDILLKAGLPMSLNAYLADLLAYSIKRSR